MKTCFITFRSVTFGQRGQRLLESAGIHCVLQRTPRALEEQGCGYCLRLQEKDCTRAMVLLRANQVSFRKLYRQQGESLEEVRL